MDWILAIPVVIVVLMLLGAVRQSHVGRARALRAAAVGQGWEPVARFDQPQGLHRLGLFKGSDRRMLSNVLRAPAAAGEALYFDYRSHPRHGDDDSDIERSIVAVRLPAPLPEFTLGREGLVSRVTSALGMGDIDFAGHPAFSKRFLLRGADETAVRAVFSSQVREALERVDRSWKDQIEVAGEWLLVERSPHFVAPRDLGPFLQQAMELAAIFVARAAAGDVPAARRPR